MQREKPALKNWKAPESVSVPDFIIGGAMKSGTSTMHAILEKHPDVFMPKEEIGFFDIDNIIEHYDFHFFDTRSKEWVVQDMVTDSEKLWQWYGRKFEPGRAEGKVLGEDSTSYLTSSLAAERIALQNKEVKMIFMLRQPSLRAYSNYYHLIRSGTVAHRFEDVLQFHPATVLKRSLYKEQLEAYYRVLPREQIKVVLFEDLVSNPEEVMKEVCRYLNLNFDAFDAEVFETHTNKGKLPAFLWLHRLKNHHSRRYGSSFYHKVLPGKAPASVVRAAWFPKVVNRIHGMINPLRVRNTPPMNPETKNFLDAYFRKELDGLDELVGKEVLSRWFP